MIELKGDKFLVTGGAGFIGSHIAEEIVRQGKEVVILDDFSAGKIHNTLPWWNRRLCTLIEADITLDDILPYFDGVDVVFHNAASKCTVCRKDPGRDLEVNGNGSRLVFEAAIHAGCRKVVHASTGSVYGDTFEELPPDEVGNYNPRSFYGVSKLAGERYLRAFKEYHPEFRYSIIRYFHVYGPRQESADHGGVVPIFIKRVVEGRPITIHGDGEQERLFTYVKDDVAANFLLANDDTADGEAFDSTAGIPITINTLARMVAEIVGKDVPVEHKPRRDGDIKHFDAGPKKLELLGHEFKTDFEAGLRETVNWYLENGFA